LLDKIDSTLTKIYAYDVDLYPVARVRGNLLIQYSIVSCLRALAEIPTISDQLDIIAAGSDFQNDIFGGLSMDREGGIWSALLQTVQVLRILLNGKVDQR
jgi:hypothetical protein